MLIDSVHRMLFQRVRFFVGAVLVASLMASGSSAAEPYLQDSPVTLAKRPTELCLFGKSNRLYVANFGDASISAIDTQSNLVVSRLGDIQCISGLVGDEDLGVLFISDEWAREVVCVDMNDDASSIRWRHATCGYPRSLRLNGDSRRLAVAGYWSRQIEIVESSGKWELESLTSRTISLSFVPGHLCWLSNEQLLVADAFGGRLAVIDAGDGQVLMEKKLIDRRIGGVAFDVASQTVVFATQMVNPLGRTDRNDVHWGLMIANQLVSFSAIRLVDPNDLLESSDRQQPFGRTGDGKADPGRCSISNDAIATVCLEGVNQIAVGGIRELSFAYVDVGARPIAIVVDSHREIAYVANWLDDTISVVNIDTFKTQATISLRPDNSKSPALVGERLFFDARLSHDRWMSCHSCHVNGHSSELLNDNFSDQTHGTPKRILSLLGCRDTAPFAWNGGQATLESQIESSITATMQSDDQPSPETIAAIAEFVRSLTSPPSVVEARKQTTETTIVAGQRLFAELNCNKCHAGKEFTSPNLYDVGFQDEAGNRLFNPPHLHGLGQRQSLFHDGRCSNLESLIDEFRHEMPRDLSASERAALLSFLRSL